MVIRACLTLCYYHPARGFDVKDNYTIKFWASIDSKLPRILSLRVYHEEHNKVQLKEGDRRRNGFMAGVVVVLLGCQ